MTIIPKNKYWLDGGKANLVIGPGKHKGWINGLPRPKQITRIYAITPMYRPNVDI